MIHLRLTMALPALIAASALAQPPEPPLSPHVFIRQMEGNGAATMFNIEMGLEGKVVKGAPYSAQATTETTQILADGTKISRKTSSTLARDSEGRTRREETSSSVGPWSSGSQPHTVIFINDPVAQANFVLDSAQHSANKAIARSVQIRKPAAADDSAVEYGGRISKLYAERQAAREKEQANIKTESLGNQTVAGVAATGTRRTQIIPAGQIGNDRPIEIVSETWYSDDLQMVVMSRHSDPRTGENTYTLSNIQRAEPDASLFAVPAGYNVQENGPIIINKSAH